MNYQDNIDFCIKEKLINPSDIFIIDGTPLEENLNHFFQFCQENLNYYINKGIITHDVRFIYLNDKKINAFVKTKNNKGVVAFNKGLLEFAYYNFWQNGKIDTFFINKNLRINNLIDNKISFLAYQLNLQFIYYHELAHLFQKSGINKSINLQEQQTRNQTNSYKSHQLELNADLYAVHSISEQLIQYIERISNQSLKNENRFLIKLLSACLIETFFQFSKNTNFYLIEFDHPHPFIRFFNVAIHLSHYIELREKNKGNGLGLFGELIDLYENLLAQGVFSSEYKKLIQSTINYKKNIVTYTYELLQLKDYPYNDAMDVWNEQA